MLMRLNHRHQLGLLLLSRIAAVATAGPLLFFGLGACGGGQGESELPGADATVPCIDEDPGDAATYANPDVAIGRDPRKPVGGEHASNRSGGELPWFAKTALFVRGNREVVVRVPDDLSDAVKIVRWSETNEPREAVLAQPTTACPEDWTAYPAASPSGDGTASACASRGPAMRAARRSLACERTAPPDRRLERPRPPFGPARAVGAWRVTCFIEAHPPARYLGVTVSRDCRFRLGAGATQRSPAPLPVPQAAAHTRCPSMLLRCPTSEIIDAGRPKPAVSPSHHYATPGRCYSRNATASISISMSGVNRLDTPMRVTAGVPGAGSCVPAAAAPRPRSSNIEGSQFTT